MRVVVGLALLLAASRAPAQQVAAIVNIADWSERLAVHSIAAAFGSGLAARECVAASVPLPTQLCGVSVTLTDGSGAEVFAPLFYVSPTQINFQVPASQWFTGKDAPRPGQSITIVTTVRVQPVGISREIGVEAGQAPAILEYTTQSGQAPVMVHANGQFVTRENPAEWGETVAIYAIGFGIYTAEGVGDLSSGRWPTSFPRDGHPAPLDRLVEFLPGRVYQATGQVAGIPTFERYTIPEFVGLAPGFVGLNQINVELSCLLSERSEPTILLEGFMGGRSKHYTVPMSDQAKAVWTSKRDCR